MSDQGSVGLLRRIFFRRFFDNDLISPSGDEHENVSLVFALLAVPGLLAAVPLLLKYMDPYILPGHRLLIALDDKFTCLALSMIVMGIVTLVEWDALVLDVRDIAILGPLPLMRRYAPARKARCARAVCGGIRRCGQRDSERRLPADLVRDVAAQPGARPLGDVRPRCGRACRCRIRVLRGP